MGNYETIPGDSRPYRAFLYDGNTAYDLCELADCVSAGWDYFAVALDINDYGVILGRGVTNGVDKLFLYDGNTIQPLDVPVSSYHSGINSSGQVVSDGFLYDGNATHDLCELVDCISAGWELLAAEAINDHGDMTGSGRLNGMEESLGFLIIAVHDVTIDIKPGKTPNVINLRSDDSVTVVALTEDGSDALHVDPGTVKFGPNEATVTSYRVKDVDRDGDKDLLLKFSIWQTGIACLDTEATLTGKLYNGKRITGTDSIQTKGCK